MPSGQGISAWLPPFGTSAERRSERERNETLQEPPSSYSNLHTATSCQEGQGSQMFTQGQSQLKVLLLGIFAVRVGGTGAFFDCERAGLVVVVRVTPYKR